MSEDCHDSNNFEERDSLHSESLERKKYDARYQEFLDYANTHPQHTDLQQAADDVAALIEPVHPNVPLDGHEHYPGQHCVGCAGLFERDANVARALEGLPPKYTESDEDFLRGARISIE